MVPPVSMMTSLRTLSGICLDRLDGRWPRLLVSLAKVDVLVLDDLALRPLTTAQAADLLEVIEDRSQGAPPSSPASFRSPVGTMPWVSPPWPMPPSTG
jgi:DNA replication protein DnaC